MPIARRFVVGLVVGLVVASGVAAAALVVPAGAGPRPLEFTGLGRSSAAPAPPGGVTSTSERVGAAQSRVAGALTVSGSVSGLYPGATLPLPLTIVNASRTPVTVTSVTTSVANASRQCKKANLVVTAFTGGELVVPAGGHAVVTVAATMVTAAGNACQGAVFALRYHGRGSTR